MFLICWPAQNGFCDEFEKWQFQHYSIFYFSENLQKSIKRDVSDPTGPQKRVCRVKNIHIDPGETNFWCMVTNFMRTKCCRPTLTQFLHGGSNVLKWWDSQCRICWNGRFLLNNFTITRKFMLKYFFPTITNQTKTIKSHTNAWKWMYCLFVSCRAVLILPQTEEARLVFVFVYFACNRIDPEFQRFCPTPPPLRYLSPGNAGIAFKKWYLRSAWTPNNVFEHSRASTAKLAQQRLHNTDCTKVAQHTFGQQRIAQQRFHTTDRTTRIPQHRLRN